MVEYLPHLLGAVIVGMAGLAAYRRPEPEPTRPLEPERPPVQRRRTLAPVPWPSRDSGTMPTILGAPPAAGRVREGGHGSSRAPRRRRRRPAALAATFPTQPRASWSSQDVLRGW